MAGTLTEEQIGQIVDAYRLQMARYENVAKFVEQRLRRELRAAALPVLLSSRAKHPEDLREKLRRRTEAGDPRYQLEPLIHDVNKLGDSSREETRFDLIAEWRGTAPSIQGARSRRVELSDVSLMLGPCSR